MLIKQSQCMKRHSLETLRKKNRKNLIGCEIGVQKGVNALDILENLDILRLYLIDPYLRDSDYHKIALESLGAYKNKIVWIHKRSQDITDEEIPPESLDFVYIDGDHLYEPVKKDIELYWPRVKPGGLFAGHDYPGEQGVYQAVNERFGKSGFSNKGRQPGDWWVYK